MRIRKLVLPEWRWGEGGDGDGEEDGGRNGRFSYQRGIFQTPVIHLSSTYLFSF